MATGLSAAAIIQNLIASGPIWSAVVPVVSSLSSSAIELVSGWRRDRARKRYESTFGRLGTIEAALLERIKNSMALIEACDELVARADRRQSRKWTWLVTLVLMIFTGFQIQPDQPLNAGGNDLSLPVADTLDPLIATLGGVFAAWLGNGLARFQGQEAVEIKTLETRANAGKASPNDRVVLHHQLLRYATVREGAISSLVAAISGEIMKKAMIQPHEVDEMRRIEARTGWQKTVALLSSPYRWGRRYFLGDWRL